MKRLKVKEVAEVLGLHPNAVRWMCETNQMPPGFTVIVKQGKGRKSFYIFGEKDEKEGRT